MDRHHLAALTMLALAACKKDEPDPKPTTDHPIMLQRFESCDALRGYVSEVWTEYLVQSLYGWGWAVDDDAEAGEDGGGEDGGGSDWSETNVQEEGVDEPDLVKTDGAYLYIVQNNELTIVDAWPAEGMEIVSSLSLDGYPFAMFLYESRLAVFSYWYEYDDGPDDGEDKDERAADFRYGSAARVTIFDVSDPTAPEALREVDVEGWYTDARMIGSDVYMVASTWADAPDGVWELAWDDELGLPELDSDPSEAEIQAAMTAARAVLLPEVTAIIGALPIEDLVPRYRDQVPGEDADLLALGACSDIYRTSNLSLPAYLVLTHLDLAEGEAGSSLSATSVMAQGWTVYASQENLYAAQTSWYWFWDSADSELDTQIHKFSLSGATSAYEASGEVQGWLLNQFSMSEHQGDLRVSTTDIDSWWGAAEGGDVAETDEGGSTTGRVVEEEPPANNVFVLRQMGDELHTIGSLTGLAPGERIYATRFLGDRGFLVTFEQVDPLFTIDLSDPTDPRLVGELEIPGYSSYLHPVGQDHLLAVGMEGTPDGTITGFAVSLFDVTDFATPLLDARLTVASDDWSWSEALWDHHAFTYYNGILTVPLYTYDYDGETDDWEQFSGLWVIEVDEAAGTLTELGRVDHADLVEASECLYGDWEGCEEYYWYAWMRRSVVIEETLYSLSDYGVKANEHAAPDHEISAVLFRPKE